MKMGDLQLDLPSGVPHRLKSGSSPTPARKPVPQRLNNWVPKARNGSSAPAQKLPDAKREKITSHPTKEVVREKRKNPWTDEELKLFDLGTKKFGPDLLKIQRYVQTRSLAEIQMLVKIRSADRSSKKRQLPSARSEPTKTSPIISRHSPQPAAKTTPPSTSSPVTAPKPRLARTKASILQRLKNSKSNRVPIKSTPPIIVKPPSPISESTTNGVSKKPAETPNRVSNKQISPAKPPVIKSIPPIMESTSNGASKKPLPPIQKKPTAMLQPATSKSTSSMKTTKVTSHPPPPSPIPKTKPSGSVPAWTPAERSQFERAWWRRMRCHFSCLHTRSAL
eukprot:TRINITY_DN1983_c0_g2_i1.p1 TRINITY_DN1983_c0_g2~~TRINITY_DN1983_c0_g2_i1.p1  ORF type:complete len:336 (+),score=-42.67 TRINITY_DN1983_c0_g2_i1:126-1133(+)